MAEMEVHVFLLITNLFVLLSEKIKREVEKEIKKSKGKKSGAHWCLILDKHLARPKVKI